jgi:hypothetical protein
MGVKKSTVWTRASAWHLLEHLVEDAGAQLRSAAAGLDKSGEIYFAHQFIIV